MSGNFPCRICSRPYKSKGARGNHEREKHREGAGHVECPVCAERMSKRNLKRHLFAKHPYEINPDPSSFFADFGRDPGYKDNLRELVEKADVARCRAIYWTPMTAEERARDMIMQREIDEIHRREMIDGAIEMRRQIEAQGIDYDKFAKEFMASSSKTPVGPTYEFDGEPAEIYVRQADNSYELHVDEK